MEFVPQLIVSGIAAGSLYALVAIGLVLIHKATGVVNFAQGQSVTIGAYLGWMFVTVLHVQYVVAFAAVLASAALIGIVLERVAFRPLINSPPFTVILATLAVGLMIDNVIRLVWQDMPRSLRGAVSVQPIEIGNVLITPGQMVIMFATLLVVTALGVFFRVARLGKAMRATAMSQEAAALMGINVSGIFSRAWAMGSALGGLAGLLIAPMVGVNTGLSNVLVEGFVAAVVGGFTSISGAVVGGIMLGILENFAGVFISSTFKQVVSFLILIAVLMVKPSGLFGRPVQRAI